MRACRARSVDGHPLPIDELKGTKPTERIDFSRKRLGPDSAIPMKKQLSVASAIIIASCIKDNVSLKELSLKDTDLGVEGAKTIAAVLKDTQLVHLEYAVSPPPAAVSLLPRQHVRPR